VTVSEIDISPTWSNTGGVDALYREFGRSLRTAREAADLTQKDVAERVGLSRTSVTNIERGSQHIALHQLFLLADAVGVEPSALLPDGDVALEQLVPARALKGLDLDDEQREFAVRIVQKNEDVTGNRATEPGLPSDRDE
jgi:transcriptional regulator with XRE-family HTH domain